MDSFQKRERERKKLQNRRDKADRKRQRSEHGVPAVDEAVPADPVTKVEARSDERADGTKPDPGTA